VDCIAVSPDNKMILTADLGTSQLKAFNPQTGDLMWKYGQEGGYGINGPDVTNDKFYFKDLQNDFSTFIAFQPDGSFWVGDPGNTRVLHFTADRNYINSIAYRPISYSTVTDLNVPTRVFTDYCEYAVDYSKPISPNNGSWKLVKNWGAVIPKELADKYGRLRNVMTLKNGRTYALINQINKQGTIQVGGIASKG
jgi:WD40 repeat protein